MRCSICPGRRSISSSSSCCIRCSEGSRSRCALLLVLMALINERLVRPPMNESNEAASRNYAFTEMSLRNAEVVQAMGMIEGLLRRWGRDRVRMIGRQVTASDRAAVMSSLIRFLRLAMQSLILGLGAYLVIEHSITVGAMFASSILLGRALQPVEQIVGSWRGLVSARECLSPRARSAGGQSAARKPSRTAAAGGPRLGRGPDLSPAAQQQADSERRLIPHRARRGDRDHRTLGRRKIHAGAQHRRRAQTQCGSGAPGRRRYRNLAASGARPTCRLSSPGRRTVR